MASFEKASVILKSKEGGYQQSEKDSGNYINGILIGTNHGIAAPTLNAWRGGNNNNVVITKQDMINLPYSEALKIYKKEFWDTIEGDKINNDSIAQLIFDGAVNQGVGGIKNAFKKYFGVSYSANYINNYNNQKELFEKIQNARIKRYEDNYNATWHQQWINRVKSYAYVAGQTAVKTQKFVKKNIVPIVIISVSSAVLIGTILYFVISKKIK